MINPTIKLASIAVGVGGIVTGTGVGIYQMTRSKQEDKKDRPESTKPLTPEPGKQSIATLLTGVKLLGEATEDTTTWTQKWDAFKQEHNTKEPADPWKIKDWNTKKDNNEGLAEFKKLCETNSKTKVENKNDPLYVAVVKNCTKPVASNSTSIDPARPS